MAAAAWSKYGDPDDVWGRRRVTLWTLTLSATAYVAGGIAVSGSTFGVKSILGMQLMGNSVLMATAGTVLPQYNSATGKLQFFGTGASDTAVLDEFVSASMTATMLFLVYSISD